MIGSYPLWPLQAPRPHLSPKCTTHVHVFCHASLSPRLLNVPFFLKDVIIGSEHRTCLYMLNFASCLSRVYLKCKCYVWSVVYRRFTADLIGFVECFMLLFTPSMFLCFYAFLFLLSVNWTSFCVCVWEWKGMEQERDTQIEILIASVQHGPWVLNTQQPKSFINKVEQQTLTNTSKVLLDIFDNIAQLV